MLKITLSQCNANHVCKMLQTISTFDRLSVCNRVSTGCRQLSSSEKSDDTKESPRIQEFRKKLRERTPIERLEEHEEGKHPYQEKEPLQPFPDNTNPTTGEIGGPRGPEPTRYGDWERKGRVTDF